jgi:hypothetical protein
MRDDKSAYGKKGGPIGKMHGGHLDYFGGKILLFCPKQFEKSLEEHVFLV